MSIEAPTRLNYRAASELSYGRPEAAYGSENAKPCGLEAPICACRKTLDRNDDLRKLQQYR